MERKIKGLDITVYEENINGLRVYTVPNNKFNGIYATLSVNFGGDLERFKNGNKTVELPRGTAHFIEHQVFNQKDGEDIFSFFSAHGSNCNANTRNDKTTYLFSGVNFFHENLDKLLDFVLNPYFTDESVEKEKGIIQEEIGMYQDDPYSQMIYRLYENTFKNHPVKTPLIGSKESVSKITKEDLYLGYDNFYQLDNMFLVITGNIEVDKVKSLVYEKLKNIKSSHKKPLTLTINEPDKIVKKEDNLKLKVKIPKLAIGFKLNINALKNVKRFEVLLYLNFLFQTKLGNTSALLEKLKANDLIIDDFYITSTDLKTHVLFIVQAETNHPEALAKEVLNEFKDLHIKEEELERRKKVLLSYQILGSENIYQINQKLMNNIASYDEVLYDTYDAIKSLNIKQYNYIINNVSFSNRSVLYVKNK